MNIWLSHDVGRAHLYSSVSIASTFYDRATGATLPKVKQGTAFILDGASTHYYVTNRHVVDYNYKPRLLSDVIPGAELDSVLISGHEQPVDREQDTVPWQAEFRRPRFRFHTVDEVDLAVLEVHDADSNIVHMGPGMTTYSPNNYDLNEWLATTDELNSVLPGDQIFISGFPAVNGVQPERPLIVSGIVSSDPRYPAVFGPERLEHSVFCHSFSWGGMSGAPVLGWSRSIDRNKIFG